MTENQTVQTTEVIERKTPVVEATKVKKSLWRRTSDLMFGQGGARRIGEHVGREIILPAFKDTLSNGLKAMIDMMVYKSGGAPNHVSNRYSGTNNVVFRNYATTQSSTSPTINYNTATTGIFDARDYVIASREMAQDVVAALNNDLVNFGQVTLADFYDYIGVDTTTRYTDLTFGWTDLRLVSIRNTRGGYYIDMPQLESLR